MSSLHQRAKDVFLAALERPPAERAAFLADACGDDAALRQEAESLLRFHEDDNEAETAPGVPSAAFAPGEVLADRYRMIARIGRGGMGDVWRADDLVLQTPVALKLIHSAAPEGRERILNEVRLARQITHPAVCRVFDVGEAAGGIFYTMELIEGEDLAALIRRVGRLPSNKVADIGRQLCGGLAVAHAQGVLHRDLKPANVLIDNQGQVRITDFGIAITRTDAGRHRMTGTPAYMAPEQLASGTPLSERTDVYSLGLVLYELLVGQSAFDRLDATSEIPRPSTLVPNVSPQLERVVMQALSSDPAGRPSSALAMAASLTDGETRHDTTSASPATSRPRIPWWMAAALAAGVVGLALVASSFFVSPGARTLTERDTIVLADFENTTGDPVFDGALKVAFAVALEQSPFLKVFPDDQARETLRLMQRPPDQRVTRAIAREVARREQLKALLAGSIASLGRNYVLSLEAVNAETGDVMGREQAEAASKEQVLAALGTATLRLRQKLGESLASVQKFDVPLPRATTASLDALHAYSLALYEGREVPRLEAIPHLKRAIELDPTFAMAHALMSAVYANTGQSALAPAFSRKAFELRDRVSERERFFISWRYYRDAIQAWDKGLELAQSWTATYPREAFAFNSLGSAQIRLGRFEDAVQAFRAAIGLDARFSPAYSNLAAALIGVERPADARVVLQQAAERKLSFNGNRRLSYLLAFVQGDSKTMARELDASVGLNETNSAFGWQAHTSAFGGRIEAAHEQFRRGIQMSLRGNFEEVAAQLMLEDAETHAIVGQCAEARGEVPSGLALSRDNLTLERASRVLALCGAGAEAAGLSSELARRFPEATLTVHAALPVTAALLALQRGGPSRGVELLEPARSYDRAPSVEFWPAYVRGLAYLQLKNGRTASLEFQGIVDHPGVVPASTLYPLARLGLARAAAMAGDKASAGKEYQAFLDLWREADSTLQPLKDARVEQSRLQ
jgi:serine/threonine protein kinase/Flp pilus assembly protein TadD